MYPILAKNKLPIATLLCAIILRFYKIGPFTVFLSDQGRDAIIVKRIITLEHLPAIGPPTSIGHIFLGPFYYYLIAPFLWITKLNPVGMAIGVAFLSIIGLVVCYLIIRKEYKKSIADIFLILATFSFINIDYSRFSWNPNPLPYFSFITLYLAVKSFQTKKIVVSFLFGSFLAMSIQLHYLAILLAVPVALLGLYQLINDKQKLKLIVSFVVSVAGFIVFSAPLILFDLKHQFLNSKNLIALLQKEGNASGGSSVSQFSETTGAFFTHILQIPIAQSFSIIVLAIFAGVYLLLQRKKWRTFEILNLSTIFMYLLGFSTLVSFRHPHYYMSIYFSLFFLTSIILYTIFKQNYMYSFAVIIVVLLYIGANAQKYYFFNREPNDQISHAQRFADYLAPKIKNKPFNIATWPIDFTEDTYLYYLELRGLRPADRERSEVTDQMFVLCNAPTCSIIDSPSWNISMFGRAKIENQWEFERIKIFRLVHGT